MDILLDYTTAINFGYQSSEFWDEWVESRIRVTGMREFLITCVLSSWKEAIKAIERLYGNIDTYILKYGSIELVSEYFSGKRMSMSFQRFVEIVLDNNEKNTIPLLEYGLDRYVETSWIIIDRLLEWKTTNFDKHSEILSKYLDKLGDNYLAGLIFSSHIEKFPQFSDVLLRHSDGIS